MRNLLSDLLVSVSILAVCTLIGWATSPASAHVDSRPELDNWFHNLQNQHGGSCCFNAQKEAVEVDDYKGPDADGDYEIHFEGHWVHAPADTVIRGANKYGAPLAWPKSNRREVWCFAPGAGF